VVVPFFGPVSALEELETRLQRLRRRPGDTLLIVDNTPRRDGTQIESTVKEADGAIPVLRVADRQTPGYARNRGARGINWGRVRDAGAALIAAARSGDRDRLLWAVFEPLEMLTWKLGRSLPNERPLRLWPASRRAG